MLYDPEKLRIIQKCAANDAANHLSINPKYSGCLTYLSYYYINGGTDPSGRSLVGLPDTRFLSDEISEKKKIW